MKDNMEELQRWHIENGAHTEEAPEGGWALVSDVQEREARFQARIEELEVIVSGKTMYDAASVADARWRERIEGKAREYDDVADHAQDKGMESRAMMIAAALRSLLDSGEMDGYGNHVSGPDQENNPAISGSGEEQKCPDCEGEDIRGCSRCDGSGRATTPSPAFHREGREQFCPEKTQKNWTTDGRSAPVAVPERVEAVARAIYDTVTQDDDWEVLDERDVYREEYLDMARAALSVMGSGKVEVNRDDLESLLDTYDRPGNEVTARLRAVLEQERGEGCDR